ncbi:serine/threonine-protein kinase RIM15-like [Penaeus japonicus]|uniref:serine/threonine-protein kinase RIM15-like n=1 Tax=Penaeus japonicus TaxID=27405 RepID=UPI001C70ED1B|nr:serine/threonine-protein kinase RIM15-like [Penaeus japonicus]
MSAVVRRLASCMPSDAASTRRASCGSLDIAASLAHSEAKSRERCASIGAQDLQKERPSAEYLKHKRPSLDPSWLTPKTQATFVDSLGGHFLQLLKQSSFYDAQDRTSFASPQTRRNSAHTPIDSAHTPINSTHTPISSAHTPVNSAHTPISSAHTPINSTHTPINPAHTPINSTHTPINPAHLPVDSAHTPARTFNGKSTTRSPAAKQRASATTCNGLLQDATTKPYLMRRRHTLQQADLIVNPEVANPRKCSAPSLVPFPALSPCLEGKRKVGVFFPPGRRDSEAHGEGERSARKREGWEGMEDDEDEEEDEEEEKEERRGGKNPRIVINGLYDDQPQGTNERDVLCTSPPEVKGQVGPLTPRPPYAFFPHTGIFRGVKDRIDGGYSSPTSCSSNHHHHHHHHPHSSSTCDSTITPTNTSSQPTPTPTVGAVLGRGGFGTVKVGCYKGTHVAVKVLKGRRAAASATQEANLLPLRPHAHITSTYAVVTPTETAGLASITWAPDQVVVLPAGDVATMFSLPDEDLTAPTFLEDEEDAHEGERAWAWVVSELCTPRTLLTLINDPAITLHARDKVRYIRELASGLTYLHAQGIVHRDVKPANALLDSRGRTRLTDFGCSSRPGQDEVAVIGTVPYQAPEVLRGGMGCSRSDVFSLGVTTWHLLTRHAPFEGLHHHVVLYQELERHSANKDTAYLQLDK